MQGHKSGTELCIGVALGKRLRSVRETFEACISIFPPFDLDRSLLQSTSSHPQQILSGLLHVAIVLQDNNLTAADEYHLQRGAANASLVDRAGKSVRAILLLWRRGSGIGKRASWLVMHSSERCRCTLAADAIDAGGDCAAVQ